MLLSQQEAKGICQKLLGYVKAEDAAVSVESRDSSHLRFADNNFTTSGRREDIEAGVTCWVEGKKGAASTNELDDAQLEAAVRQAEQLARLSPVDREYLPTLAPQSYKPSQGYVEATANISLTARAKTINDVIAACEKESVSGAGFHQARGVATAHATKNGNFSYARSSLVSLSLTSRTRQGEGSGYFLRNHFDVAKLDTARIAHESIQKALHSRHARAVEPGAYTVILEPQAVADLLGLGAFFFDARPADEGRSPFSAPGGKTKVGEKIFDARINVYSDPWHPELPGSQAAPSGIPAQKLYLVRNGVLETLVYSRYWAKQKQKEPTPGPVNLILESAQPPAGVEEMVHSTDRGLLVSRFWYLRFVDPRTLLLTGLTRDGVWYVEKGKIQYPVRNFRFNQSLLEMLSPGNVELIGAPERVGSSEAQGSASALLPALKVKQFHFTSQSEAV
jgi:predicted Zn-dependent protease